MFRFSPSLVLLFLAACASGGAGLTDTGADLGSGPDMGLDSGETADVGPDTGDAGTDSAIDVGPGERLTCEACEDHPDCADGFYCVGVGGGKACLPRCNRDIPDCPPRFECVEAVGTDIPDLVCAPIGERCCVDPDGDLHGEGLGCLGTDCDEADEDVNSSATEVCDGADTDCNDVVDDGDVAMMCPTGDQVATSACTMGRCGVAECVTTWADCDSAVENGCEQALNSPEHCGGCGTPCAPENAIPSCPDGMCDIAGCMMGFGDCDMRVANGCETMLDSPFNCGTCGHTCSVLNAVPGCDGTACTVASCNGGFADCDGSPLNGCETSTTTNGNCGGCGMICAPAHGVGECSTGGCRIVNCATGWEDCDGDPSNGCEVNTRTLADCGACGVTCSLGGGMASCASGTCQLSGCDPNSGDCDGIALNGCETPLNTAANCGGCGVACFISHGTGGCGTGICAVAACDPGYEDCDGIAANGCEVEVNTLTNCGGCGATCDLDHAGQSCGSGICTLGTCDVGYGNCNGTSGDGCERSLSSTSDCGGCGVVCDIPGATETCPGGHCTMNACESGYSNCDGNNSNGCERNHADVVGFCGTTTGRVRDFDGDTNCGLFCGGNTGWNNIASKTGHTSAWFQGRVIEDSICSASIEHQFRLIIPAGIRYDLFVYEDGDCITPVASQTGDGNKTVVFNIPDTSGVDDDTTYNVEVRYVSGTSCSDWQLYFDGHDC